MARYRILTWRGIPAQIKVYRDNGRPLAIPLDDWFIKEVDRVAMREGITGSDEYLQLWQWSEELECNGSAEEVAETVTAELEAEWLPKRRRA